MGGRNNKACFEMTETKSKVGVTAGKGGDNVSGTLNISFLSKKRPEAKMKTTFRLHNAGQ